MVPLSADAMNATLTEGSLDATLLMRANSLLYGIPRIKLAFGYFGNARSGGRTDSAEFLPAIRAPRFSAEVSLFPDGWFILGLQGSATLGSTLSALQAGAFVLQRVAEGSPWMARVSVNLGRLAEAAGGRNETWMSLAAGVQAQF